MQVLRKINRFVIPWTELNLPLHEQEVLQTGAMEPIAASSTNSSSHRRASLASTSGPVAGLVFGIIDFASKRLGASQRQSASLSATNAKRTRACAGQLPRRLFVVMPFSQEFYDVYWLGICEVADKMGLAVERADDIEHNGGVVEVIQERIRDSDAVVADVTHQNPNVLYEVGYAHASATPTILIARCGEELPFDLRAMNHIFYENIVALRAKLERRLTSIF